MQEQPTLSRAEREGEYPKVGLSNWSTSHVQVKLEEALNLATKFHNSLQDFINWLTQAEQTLTLVASPSLILDTILFQIDEHKVNVNSERAHGKFKIYLSLGVFLTLVDCVFAALSVGFCQWSQLAPWENNWTGQDRHPSEVLQSEAGCCAH